MAFANDAELRPADLVLVNGRVVTLDEEHPEAEALAVRGGRILAVGRTAGIRRLIGPQTRVIDLQGRLALPGFIDSHAHFLEIGRERMSLDLSDARNWEDVVGRVAAEAQDTPAGTWIVGHSWHQAKWERPPAANVDGYPVHTALSEATPDSPVLLRHASGHLCLANARAMDRAGITAETPDPAEGEILRDADGEPIGVFREAAQGLIERAYQQGRAERSPGQRESDLRKAFELATEACLSRGVTSMQDAAASFETVDFFKRLADEGELQVRLSLMIHEPVERLREKLDDYRMVGYGGHRLSVRALKRFADGALGSHGALLLEPYSDRPEGRGNRLEPLQELRATAELALEHDYQLCVHAIGDRANRDVLDLYEELFERFPSETSRRWRIEHAQHVHPDDVPRFAELGVIASMQPVHCVSDAPFVVRRLGEERARRGAYPWRRLLDAGARIASGTDAPVEDVDPIPNFHAAVTRCLEDGGRFFPEQRMSRREAIRSMTLDAAYAAFEEDLKGSLAPGKLADIVVLSRDILQVPEEEIREARVEWTILGGEVVYSRE